MPNTNSLNAKHIHTHTHTHTHTQKENVSAHYVKWIVTADASSVWMKEVYFGVCKAEKLCIMGLQKFEGILIILFPC